MAAIDVRQPRCARCGLTDLENLVLCPGRKRTDGGVRQCWVRYCGTECQKDHWRTQHKAVCGEKRCITCERPNERDYRIFACYCRHVMYCGTECQKRDWEKHRWECTYEPPEAVAASAGPQTALEALRDSCREAARGWRPPNAKARQSWAEQQAGQTNKHIINPSRAAGPGQGAAQTSTVESILFLTTEPGESFLNAYQEGQSHVTCVVPYWKKAESRVNALLSSFPDNKKRVLLLRKGEGINLAYLRRLQAEGKRFHSIQIDSRLVPPEEFVEFLQLAEQMLVRELRGVAGLTVWGMRRPPTGGEQNFGLWQANQSLVQATLRDMNFKDFITVPAEEPPARPRMPPLSEWIDDTVKRTCDVSRLPPDATVCIIPQPPGFPEGVYRITMLRGS
jgi:hypothetical protein